MQQPRRIYLVCLVWDWSCYLNNDYSDHRRNVSSSEHLKARRRIRRGVMASQSVLIQENGFVLSTSAASKSKISNLGTIFRMNTWYLHACSHSHMRKVYLNVAQVSFETLSQGGGDLENALRR